MNANEFKNKMETSFGLQLIITGLTRLVEEEGYTPHEAFRLLDDTQRNIFPALMEIGSERND